MRVYFGVFYNPPNSDVDYMVFKRVYLIFLHACRRRCLIRSPYTTRTAYHPCGVNARWYLTSLWRTNDPALRHQPSCPHLTTSFKAILFRNTIHKQLTYHSEIQTHERFRRTQFIRTKHNWRIFGVIPFIKPQNDT